MYKINRIKELIQILIDASDAYYNSGDVVMSDKEYDSLFDELIKLEKETGVVMSDSPTQNVGAKILTELNKVTHNHPMLSLDKCHSVEEIINFSNNKSLVAMAKLDGLTISLKYKNGKLVSAETRGDGQIGGDVMEHVKQFLNVPLTINKLNTYVVDGEAIITNEDFKEINKNNEFANSRNLASGTLSVLDTNLVSERRLKFIAWDVIKGEKGDHFVDRLQNAEKLGFDIVPYCLMNTSEINDENILLFINKIKKNAEDIGLPIDGVVWKFNNIDYGKSLGSTGHHFKNAIAYKFKDEAVKSILKDIEWQVGKSGIITPIAVFEPIEIEGTIVERASLHNLSVMNRLWSDIWYSGLNVFVIKANQIIPQIISINYPKKPKNPKQLNYPVYCPSCGTKTKVIYSKNTKNIICTNILCKGKLLEKLKHFVSKNAMNIEGLSEATLKKLIDKGFVESFIDIYELKDGFYEDIINMDGFGQRSADKLFDSIEKSKNTTLDKFIYAISIPMVGKTASKVIGEYFEGEFCSFYNGLTNNFDWTQLKGFGDEINNSITDYANNERNLNLIWELASYFNFEEYDEPGNNLSGKTFVITGKLNLFENRDAAKNAIEYHGGKVSNSVSKNTDYLISNNILSTSGKNKKAKQLNISIITEEELLLMLK